MVWPCLILLSLSKIIFVMKNLFYLLLLITFVGFISSCNKDEGVENNNDGVYNFGGNTSLQIGDDYLGGIVFQLSGQQALVAELEDLGGMNWFSAMDSESGGWFIPSISQLETMYYTIGPGANNVGNFSETSYWSSTSGGPSSSTHASYLNFYNGTVFNGMNPVLYNRVRRIRSVSL